MVGRPILRAEEKIEGVELKVWIHNNPHDKYCRTLWLVMNAPN